MRKMILYKEWLKTRWFLLGAALVLAAATAFTLLNVSKTAELNGADVLWSTLIAKDTVLIEMLRYLPLAAGVLLAVAQFLPETTAKRLKITLHLPYPQGRMVAGMYGYGILALVVLFGLQVLALNIALRNWFVPELVNRILATSAVWFLAGFAGYLWTAAVILEPAWRMRIVLLVLLAGLIRLFFISNVPESFNGILPWLAIYVLGGQLLIFHSIARFKEGIQE